MLNESKQEMVQCINTRLNVATVHDGQLYSNLFDNSHSIMLIINPDTGEIVDANTAASKFYGYEKLELTQMKVTEINTLSKEQIFEEMEKAKTNKRNTAYPVDSPYPKM